MAIEDIITKLKGIEGLNLTEEEIKEIQGVKSNTDTDATIAALSAEKAAKARILEEKKKALVRAAELETQLEELKTKDLSEVEQLQAQMAKLSESNKAGEDARLVLQQQYDTTVRSYSLDKIGSTIKFLDTIPGDLRNLAIKSAFADVDISDDVAVAEAKKGFLSSYSSIIAAEDAAIGSGAQAGKIHGQGTKTADQMTVDERAKYLADNKKL